MGMYNQYIYRKVGGQELPECIQYVHIQFRPSPYNFPSRFEPGILIGPLRYGPQ